MKKGLSGRDWTEAEDSRPPLFYGDFWFIRGVDRKFFSARLLLVSTMVGRFWGTKRSRICHHIAAHSGSNVAEFSLKCGET